MIQYILLFVLNTKQPLSNIWLLRYKQNSFGCFWRNLNFVFREKNHKSKLWLMPYKFPIFFWMILVKLSGLCVMVAKYAILHVIKGISWYQKYLDDYIYAYAATQYLTSRLDTDRSQIKVILRNKHLLWLKYILIDKVMISMRQTWKQPLELWQPQKRWSQ